MALLRRILLLAALTAAVTMSCFSPARPPCAFSCAEDGLCPAGFSCLDDGVCHRDGDQRTCDIPPQTGAGDGGPNDAPSDTADAAD